MTAKTPTGLSVGIKQRLIQQALERYARVAKVAKLSAE